MNKTFNKFGRLLTDPISDLSLPHLGELKVTHNYKKNSKFELPALDKLMKTKISKAMTERWADMICALCGSSHNIEVHHLRSVKEIRQKIRTGDSTYAQWKGGFIRKQIPLCNYHHNLLHKGQLSALDLRTLHRFTKGI